MPNAQWRPFTAEQVITVHKPAFAWLARMQVMPLLSAHILDGYLDGEGLLEARLCGSLPLARAAGQEVSRGELMRYLAELIWAPHALRHNTALSWREIDATTVEVSASSTGGPARVRLIFENGDVASIEGDDRPRVVGHRIVPTRWRGCCGEYREMQGCRVPTRASVSWLLDDGPFEYWRGKVTAYGDCRLRREKAGLLTWISAVAGRGSKILRWVGGCITKAVIENLALRRRTGLLRSP